MRDPLEELRNLSLDDTGAALSASEVRRRGDRLRHRRTAVQATGVAAAVALIAGGGAVMSGTLTSSTPPAGPAESPSAVPPTTTPEPTPSEAPSVTVSPSPSSATPEPEPAGGWRTEIPAGVVEAVRASLPAAGGDVPEAEEDPALDLPWRGLPCGSRGDGKYPDPLTSTWLSGVDERRTDQRFVSVSPPAGFQARQLAVYENGGTAAEAVAAIALQAEGCAPEPDPDLPTELRWTTSTWEAAGTEALLLSGGSFVEGTDERTVGRTLVTVVRRGNAVLTAQLSDESSASLDATDDPDARALVRATTQLADRMCVFSSEECAE